MSFPVLHSAALLLGLCQPSLPAPKPQGKAGPKSTGHLLSGSQVALYSGYHGIGEGVDSGELGVEFRLPPCFQDLQFTLGYMATSDEASMVYVGSRYPLRLSERVNLSPSGAIGYFDIGEGQDLGGELMFRVGAEVTRLYGDWQLGLGVYHYSNSGTGYINPGLESVLLTCSYGL